MLKTFFLLLILSLVVTLSKAQSDDHTYNLYGNFEIAVSSNDIASAIKIGEQILPDTLKLAVKTRTNFYSGLAKTYAKDGQNDKAILYYEKVAAAVPDYYVAHRALGFLYLNPAADILKKLMAYKGDKPGYNKLFTNYKAAVKKALPHLEKAQACDPDEKTLAIIKTLYKNTDDVAGLNSLNTRLKPLSNNCMDILSSD